MSSLDRLEPAATAEGPPAPLRGRRHGEDRLHLLVRDPRRVFATWEISEALARTAMKCAESARAPVRYRLWIDRVAREGDSPRTVSWADLPDAVRGEGWYLDLPQSGGFARARIGLDLPGGPVTLLESRWMPVPPDGPCADVGDWDIDAASAEWLARQERIARIHRPGASPSSVSRFLDVPGRSEA